MPGLSGSEAAAQIRARVWTFDEAQMPEVARTGFVFVSGQTQAYNGQVQLIAETIRGVDVEQKDLQRLLPVTKRDIRDMMQELSALLRSLQHPGMRALAEQLRQAGETPAKTASAAEGKA